MLEFRVRHLDGDLGAIIKAADEFDWQRINFVLEALLWVPLTA